MISASAVDTFRACPRKKAWDWADPRPYEPGHAAKHGTLIHEVAEAYHKHGTAPDESAPPYTFVDDEGTAQIWLAPGKALMPALPFVPRPNMGRAEGKFSFTHEAVQYIGYIDLLCDTGHLGMDPYTPVVIDYKSKETLSARGMFEGPGDFLADPQAVLYAFKVLRECPDAAHVFMRWIYIKRQGRPAAKAVDAMLTRAQVVEAFDTIVRPTAETMIKLRTHRKRLDVLKVPWNADTCMKYGPRYACPRIKQCQLTARQKLVGPSEGMMDDLLAELEAMTTNDAPKPDKAQVAAEPPKPVNPERIAGPVQANGSEETAPVGIAVVTDEEIGRVVRFLLGK